MTTVSRLLGLACGLKPPEYRTLVRERDLPVEVEPGVALLTDRWCPADADPVDLPVVLMRSPYGRNRIERLQARLIAERGYQVMVQSCRGTFGSGGTFVPFRHEAADGAATVRWMESQPWWSGRLATFGSSYLGMTQWALTADPPSSLQAMVIHVSASRFRDSVVFPGGSLGLETGVAWLYFLAHQELPFLQNVRAQWAANRGRILPALRGLPFGAADTTMLGRPIPYFQEWMEHTALGDAWWDPVDFGQKPEGVPPVLSMGGWFDLFLPAQIDDFVALRAAGRQARLVVGPWTHESPKGTAAAVREGLRFLDGRLRRGAPVRRRWTRRRADAPPDEPHAPDDPRPPEETHAPDVPVRLFVMGRDRWVETNSWPPPAVVGRWHLHPGGRLDPADPPPSEPDVYVYDPANPTPGIGGAVLNPRNAGSRDQALRERRPDVLVYTTTPFTDPLTVIGPLNAEVFLEPSSACTDLFVRLCHVDRQGRSWNLSDGIIRLESDGAGVRSAGAPQWGSAERGPDGVVRVRARMWPTAMTVPAGGRLRLQVSGGAHPLYARNLGSGEPLGTGTTLVAVTHRVLHDPAHPSGIDLPVGVL